MKIISLACIMSMLFSLHAGPSCHISNDEAETEDVVVYTGSSSPMLPDFEGLFNFDDFDFALPDADVTPSSQQNSSLVARIQFHVQKTAILVALKAHALYAWMQERLCGNKN